MIYWHLDIPELGQISFHHPTLKWTDTLVSLNNFSGFSRLANLFLTYTQQCFVFSAWNWIHDWGNGFNQPLFEVLRRIKRRMLLLTFALSLVYWHFEHDTKKTIHLVSVFKIWSGLQSAFYFHLCMSGHW